MSIFAAITGFVNDGVGILFIQNDGVPIRSQWITLDLENDGKEEYYYFASDGHLTVNGKTEDGYDVNEKGQWVVNGVVQYKVEELDRQALTGAQAQAKQGTDRNGHPYLQPGASYTWGADGKPVEVPENGRNTVVTNPNTGQTFGYSLTTGNWLDLTNGNEKEHEKARKENEGVRKPTEEEARKIAEMIIRGMGG